MHSIRHGWRQRAPVSSVRKSLPRRPATSCDFPTQDAARRTVASLASSETPRRLVETPGIDYFPDVSPNGRFIAYPIKRVWAERNLRAALSSRRRGGFGACSFDGGLSPPGLGTAGSCSTSTPLTRSSRLRSRPQERSSGFGRPSKLFDVSVDATYAPRDYDVAADGRFLMAERSMSANQRQPTLVVVLNWV